jgi:hypothetical protein
MSAQFYGTQSYDETNFKVTWEWEVLEAQYLFFKLFLRAL